MTAPLTVGETLPDIALTSPAGEAVRVADFAGKKLVLFFYPKDDSPVCTAEACAFRDKFQIFQTMGALVVGVSSDLEDSHQNFVNKNRLPFILLTDEKGELRDAFGVPKKFGISPGRVTYILDKQGVVRGIYDNLLNGKSHADEALAIIRKM